MGGKWIAIVVLVVIVVGVAAGFGGYSYGLQQGQTRAQDIRNQFLAGRGLGGGTGGQGAGAGGQGFGGQGAGAGGAAGNRQFNPANFANGQVKSVSGNTIQLSTATDVVTVKLNDQTQIQKTGPGTVADIQPGERITIQGTRASDGTMTAQSVQIGGRQGGFGGGGAGSTGGAGGGNGSGAGGQNGRGTPQAAGGSTTQ